MFISQSHEGFGTSFVSALLGPFLSGDKINPLFNTRCWFAQDLPRRMTLFNNLSGKTSMCLKGQSSLALSTTTPISSHQIGLKGRTHRNPRENPNSEERRDPQKTYLEAIHHRETNLKRSPMKMCVRSVSSAPSLLVWEVRLGGAG